MKIFLDSQGNRPRNKPAFPLFRLLFLFSLGTTLTFAEPCRAAGSFRFVETGSMSQARKNHTATLLPDGKVLVAGGNALNTRRLASTELYDPATGVWTASGDMVLGRAVHTATLLGNGKVLVTGGVQDVYRIIKRSELYDPAQGNWIETGSLNTARVGHSATLLPDGRVLVAGGSNGSILTFASAELYDPATGIWTETGSMAVARADHTATLLPDGLVLVAGGGNHDGILTSSELYNPATGLWASTGSLTEAREGHTATLLENGMVLVAAGSSGHTGEGQYIMTAELYDPATGIWTETGDLNRGHAFATAILLPNGKVLIPGGAGRGIYINPVASVELYDPASGTWSTFGRLVTARQFHTSTLLPSGDVLVAGGTDRRETFASAELGTQ